MESECKYYSCGDCLCSPEFDYTSSLKGFTRCDDDSLKNCNFRKLKHIEKLLDDMDEDNSLYIRDKIYEVIDNI